MLCRACAGWRCGLKPEFKSRSRRYALTLSLPDLLMVLHGRACPAQIDRMADRRRKVGAQPTGNDGRDLRTTGCGWLAAGARRRLRPHPAPRYRWPQFRMEVG